MNAERLSESDDEVRQNIAEALVPLFNRVRAQIRGSRRQTRTEAFLPSLDGMRILDPGCGTGAILRAMGAAFPENEIVGLEKDQARFDAASASTDLPVMRGDFFLHAEKYDLIISNPPYSHALEFVQHALTLAPLVCMLLRLPWLASQRRAAWHRENPAHVNVLPKRPSFTADGKTDATEYAWFIWGTERAGTWSILSIDAADAKKKRR